MQIRKFAAIDIGSNAIRLLVHNVIEQTGQETRFRKSSLVRVPVRLGEDTFVKGEISERNIERVVATMKSFRLLIQVMGVEKFRACATSATREASNGAELLRRISEESGISVDMIDGQQEATIIAATDLNDLIRNEEDYLFIDVGGGSTEFSLITKGVISTSRSFRIGTVRLLNKMVDPGEWEALENWLKNLRIDGEKFSIIGSGGNINKLHKMSGRKPGEALSYLWLNTQFHFLNSMSWEARVAELGLNPDRADVIIPATQIFLNAARWSGAKKIQVPKIGLSDGIIKSLYYGTAP